jgi:chemotaxis response regulator CheB
MPKAAIALNAAVEILSMRRIAPRLVELITAMPAGRVAQAAGRTP